MTVTIGRRELLAALAGAAATWPLAARAQDLTVPLIGSLNSASPGQFARLVDAFRQGLREGGYVEGRNVRIEYRWVEGQFARLPEAGGRPGRPSGVPDGGDRGHSWP